MAILLGLALVVPRPARAHCDGVDGPVVTSARQALAAGKVDPVLMWVQAKDEAEIRAAFQKALAVRRLGGDARQVADSYFFETLVRVHRAGEGAPYTGLKPAGRDVGPAIPSADRALESGSPGQLMKLLTTAIHDGLHDRYMRALKARRAAQGGSVTAGRESVKAYVEYLHWVERVYQAAGGHGHAPAGGAAAHVD
jgi:hypothetical protein